ncbi:transmembrane protein 107-like isoform 1-T1 [Synchiropus picturatus]
MSAVNSLVPARFLTIISHLVIVITIFWSRDNNVKACLPLEFTQAQYDNEDRKLVVGLAITLGLFVVELAGFFSGVSMFNSSQSLLSLAVHCSASVSLSFFVFEKWECWTYWVIFAFCRLVCNRHRKWVGSVDLLSLKTCLDHSAVCVSLVCSQPLWRFCCLLLFLD